ncbi:MAG: sigma-54-dependent Fis family transcriptional regulator, partial [Myxococcota bacterium]
MDELVLCRRGEPVQTVSLSEQIVEVGRGAHCDVVVHERGVPETAFWLRHHRGRTLLYDQRSAMQRPPVYWGLDEPIFLGKEHSVHLERKTESKTSPLSAAALLPAHESAETERSLGLLVGVGSEARLIKLREAPLTVGTRSDCDVRLYDDTVSGRHLRVARMADGDGVVLRDLGSRNGTWVSGIRVVRAQVGTHALIRVGRTDLHVVERRNESSDADARSWIAVSNKMLALKSEVSRIAPLSWPVLIHGESGVGKELIARALHEESSRADGPFVTMNAGSFSSHLIDSQLFGHQRGAFTGASSLHRGVFEQAHCGTLFLDEIGELPLEHQARLLRTLESGEIRRVGDENSMQVDVRLICATHRNIQNMVEEGTFRRDLYYRLARLIV